MAKMMTQVASGTSVSNYSRIIQIKVYRYGRGKTKAVWEEVLITQAFVGVFRLRQENGSLQGKRGI